MPRFFLRHYKPGELLTTPFSPSQYLQFVVEGDLLLYNMPDEESTVMLQTNYNEVRLLGDMELLDSKFTPIFVEAKTDVYTLAFHLDAYRQQLLNDPAFRERQRKNWSSMSTRPCRVQRTFSKPMTKDWSSPWT